MANLKEHFIEQLQDVYDAERQITEALPEMAEAAADDELKDAFRTHLEETRGQIERLERIFSDLGKTASGKTCKGMKGLLAEGREALQNGPAGPSRDALLITSAQRVEHYEIAAYGTLKTWADELGFDDAADLLDETLDEESEADKLLTSIAEGGLVSSGVNEAAAKTG